MAVTSGVFGKLDCSQGVLSRLWFNSSTNAATVDVTMCNRGGSTSNIRIAIIPSSTDTPSPEDYIVFNQPVDAGATYIHSGIVMSTQEAIYVYADTLGVSARVHGFVNDLGPAATDIGMATYVNAGLALYASGFDIVSEDKAATPKLVKAIVDAYGGGGGGGSGSGGGGGGRAAMWTTLTSPINSGYSMSVPTYSVGRNDILVFIDGILCRGGDDGNVYAYKEEGLTGTPSNSITFYDTYGIGTEICVMI